MLAIRDENKIFPQEEERPEGGHWSTGVTGNRYRRYVTVTAVT